MNKKTVLLHVGYPKTATTTLQRHVFPQLNGFNYIGKSYDSGMKCLFDISLLAKLGLDPNGIDKEEAKCFIEKLQNHTDERPLLISEERIIGSIITPRFFSKKEYRTSSPHSAARDLYELFDPSLFQVKILITLRRQCDALASKYAQSFQKSYSKIPQLSTFDSFIGDILENSGNPVREGYDFLKACTAYEKYFGKDNICILPYEFFKEDADSFIRSLFLCAQITPPDQQFDLLTKENSRSTEKGKRYTKRSLYNVLMEIKQVYAPGVKIPAAKLIKRYVKQVKMPNQKEPGLIQLDPRQYERIWNLYAESNKKLDARYNVGLDRYEYYDTHKDFFEVTNKYLI